MHDDYARFCRCPVSAYAESSAIASAHHYAQTGMSIRREPFVRRYLANCLTDLRGGSDRRLFAQRR
jgi:hypothetical protein